MKRQLASVLCLVALFSFSSRSASAQVSLAFTNFSLESGTDLQVGAVYRFPSVATGVDALVELAGLSGGATLVQIDDPSPSSGELQPTINGAPNQDPQADLALVLVSAGTSTPVSVAGLEVAAIDVDGSAGRQEYVIFSGVQSYTVEGLAATAPQGPSELTISQVPTGTRVLSPTTTYSGIDPTITQVIAVGNVGAVSRFTFSIGQTGTVTTSGDRLFSWDFRVGQINFDDPTTTSLTAQIGAALSVGTISDNGDGSYDIPMTFLLEGFDDVPLFDLQIVDDLAGSFGTYVASGPLSAGQYRVDDPVIGSLTGGAVLSAANSGFDGSSDQNVLVLTSGDLLPVGATAEVSFNVTWYPPVGVTSTTNQGTARGDYSENGTADANSTDASHSGSDPDPESNGPGDNSGSSSIDLSGLPVELSSFSARLDGRDVNLSWMTASESGNAGFDVEHRDPTSSEFQSAGFVPGAGSSSDVNRYAFTLSKLTAGKHAFRLRQIDHDGTFVYSRTLELDVELAQEFTLSRAYPNPFNPATSIRFELREAGIVDLAVYDVTGRVVRSLAEGAYGAGTHEVRFQAGDLPSGLYVYRLVTEYGTESAPVVLLK